MTSAHTTGKVINPLMHQGQIDGGVVFGVGYALTEEVMFDGGRVTTTNFGEFKIPNIQDIPPLKTAVMETGPHGPGPYNSFAIGEVANTPTAAAGAHAVAGACRVRVTPLPVTGGKGVSSVKKSALGFEFLSSPGVSTRAFTIKGIETQTRNSNPNGRRSWLMHYAITSRTTGVSKSCRLRADR